MADYPDWTDLVQIVGTDIMVAVDLQAAYIMMPVDIQAQYVDLTVDIVAQTVGHITVDIAAQSAGDITVDITAQTLSNINIQINAQAVGVYLQPDWQVKAGTDKNLVGTADVDTDTWTKVLEYVVTTGKTFYACQWGFGLELNTSVLAHLRYLHISTETNLAMNGGYMGAAQSFTKPVTVVAGDKIRVYLYHLGATLQPGHAFVGGYEV